MTWQGPVTQGHMDLTINPVQKPRNSCKYIQVSLCHFLAFDNCGQIHIIYKYSLVPSNLKIAQDSGWSAEGCEVLAGVDCNRRRLMLAPASVNTHRRQNKSVDILDGPAGPRWVDWINSVWVDLTQWSTEERHDRVTKLAQNGCSMCLGVIQYICSPIVLSI